MTTQILDTLALARALVEAGWSRRYYARDRRARLVGITANSAARFCALGAIHRAAWEVAALQDLPFEIESAVAQKAEEVFRNAGGFVSHSDIAAWNDSATKKRVLALFGQACEKVGKR